MRLAVSTNVLSVQLLTIYRKEEKWKMFVLVLSYSILCTTAQFLSSELTFPVPVVMKLSGLMDNGKGSFRIRKTMSIDDNYLIARPTKCVGKGPYFETHLTYGLNGHRVQLPVYIG